MTRAFRQALAALSLTVAAPAAADPPALSLPIDCTLGTSCYIEDYVDARPGEGQRDYTCGLKSRDGHRGTDIVLLSFEAMVQGVDVLAAAPGVVDATRDGMEDVAVSAETREAIRGRECGNAVRIDHGDGWKTLYCHLQKGSLQVQNGTRVEAGDVLARVGLSGLTNVPHVHLGVLKDGKIIDPFNPETSETCGTATGDGLWKDAPDYHRAGLFTAGFSGDVPDFDAVKSGRARIETARGYSNLVLYGHVFFAEAGDRLDFVINGPEGEVFRNDVTLEAPQAQLFRAMGRKAPEDGWPAGEYRGYVTLSREGHILAVRHADVEVMR
ncbi:M23 family metallopeptidase [Roseovarius sp. A21]|uniref:M23 family metallopeptidase n=1 Tax=Roseovarius bejariae TaxID=2576383 RepID=A0A844CJY5_9RHOB|nr:M23 family metallopeptidase [Roseovarius bejariae]MRU15027.1 M23 family metallopeptidase [Roseovarius bejariae]